MLAFPASRRRWRVLAPALLVTLVLPATASAADPLSSARGFTVFSAGDATVTSNENDGSMALGGDLVLPSSGDYRVGNNTKSAFTASGTSVPTALYVGGMGSHEQNFYLDLATRLGFGEQARTVQDLFLAGRQRDAAAAVPYALVDRTSLLGDRARVADGLARLAAAGVTTCALAPYGTTLADRLDALTLAAEALQLVA